jgi:hypothetical protein
MGNTVVYPMSMTEDRFSLRYGYESKPGHPIFDEAPKRLRFFIIKSLQMYFYAHQTPGIVGEALCLPELITQGIEQEKVWEVLSPHIESCTGWEIYNPIERMHAEMKSSQYAHHTEFETGVNRVFGEESIGWKLEEGVLHRTLPVAARTQIDAVFKELENPRFAPALVHIIASYTAYNSRPRRDFDVCANAFDGCESVAKEVFGLPNGTFGEVLREARTKSTFAPETIVVLDKLYANANNHFRHGRTAPFSLKPSEIDFIYLTCLAAVLLFIRLS